MPCMTVPSSRTVTALVTYGAERLGAYGPFAVEPPWWSNVEPVAAHLRETLGVNVAVLRLVATPDGGTEPRGGHVTYHVEALDRPTSLPPQLTPQLTPLSEDGLTEPAPL